MFRSIEITWRDLFETVVDGVDASTDRFPLRRGSVSRALKQNTVSSDNDSRASEYVGLGVLVAVCLLFLLNLCLCAYKVMQGEEMAQQSRNQARSRLRPLRNPSIPVIFVNPGGSVRIGSKLKRSGSEPLDAIGEPSAPPLSARETYVFTEAAIDLERDSGSNVPQPQTTEAQTVRSDSVV